MVKTLPFSLRPGEDTIDVGELKGMAEKATRALLKSSW